MTKDGKKRNKKKKGETNAVQRAREAVLKKWGRKIPEVERGINRMITTL